MKLVVRLREIAGFMDQNCRAISASWKLRCAVKYNPDAWHSFSLFLKQWLSVL